MAALEFAAEGKAASRGNAFAQWAHAVCVLVFLSSFSALIGQFAWQHALTRRFGTDVELVTILIVALGLGLGGLFGGFLSRRRIALLPLIAALAAANSVCAFLSPLNSKDMSEWSIAVAPLIGAGLTGAMVLLAVGHLVRRSETVGNAMGEMLFVALIGAGAACLACITIPFSFLGERGSLDMAAAIHAVVALSALVLHWRNRREATQANGDTPAFWREPQLAFAPMLALAAAAGFLSFSYALFFVRVLSYAAPSQGVVFVATLGGFLIGLAVGARRAGTHCALFSTEELMRRAARGAMAANLVGLATLPLLDQLAWLDRAIIIVAMLLCLLAARAWGALLPYLAELSIPAEAGAGTRSALLCLAYVAGAAAGMVLTGLALADRLSLVAIGVTLVGGGALFALLLIAILDLPRWQKIVRGVTALVVALLALTLMPNWSANVVERLSGQDAAKPLAQMIKERAIEARSGVSAQRAND